MGIYERHVVTLGGRRQKISLESARDDAPVMVMLHGGPWSPFIYGLAYRGHYPELARHFTLVWWDQYGCGKNYERRIPDDIEVGDFARMGVDLVDEIHRHFPGRPIVLNGYSFGTYLTMETAARRPDLIAGVINLAPIMDMRQATRNFLAACDGSLTRRDRRRLQRLEQQGRYDPYAMLAERLAGKYTNCCHYHGPEGTDSLFPKWMFRLVESGDYHLRDLWGAAMGTMPHGHGPHRFARLWDSMGDIDLWPIAERIAAPVLYIQGDADLYVLPDELRDLAARRGNITYLGVPHCGHIPTAEAWPVMMDAMIAAGRRWTGC